MMETRTAIITKRKSIKTNKTPIISGRIPIITKQTRTLEKIGDSLAGFKIQFETVGGIPDQIVKIYHRFRHYNGQALMIVSTSGKQREVQVGTVIFIGKFFIVIKKPWFDVEGQYRGTSSMTIKYCDIICGEVRVMELGNI